MNLISTDGNHFQNQTLLQPFDVQLTVAESVSYNLDHQSVQECNEDPTKRTQIVAINSDPLIRSFRKDIEDKIIEIDQLKKTINELHSQLREAEEKKEQYKAMKEDEIRVLKADYEARLAEGEMKLKRLTDEADKLKQEHKEVEKQIKEELTKVKQDYEERIEELKEKNRIECLELQLQHMQETKELELRVKDLEKSLEEKKAEVERKKAVIAELKYERLNQQFQEQQKASHALVERNKELQQRLDELAVPITPTEPRNANTSSNSTRLYYVQEITRKTERLSVNDSSTYIDSNQPDYKLQKSQSE